MENDTEGDAPEEQLRDVRHPSTADDDLVDSVLVDVVEDFMDWVSDQNSGDGQRRGGRYVTDMMSTGFMGAEHADIPVGGTVAVFAQGPVGLMATKGAALQGAGRIIAVETVPNRQELAREYDADDIVDFEAGDPVEQIMELTNDEGVDAAIEALGRSETFEQCVKATKPGATISNVGCHGEGEYVNIPREEWGVGMSEKTIATGLCRGAGAASNDSSGCWRLTGSIPRT